jgi:hypothetical protein
MWKKLLFIQLSYLLIYTVTGHGDMSHFIMLGITKPTMASVVTYPIIAVPARVLKFQASHCVSMTPEAARRHVDYVFPKVLLKHAISQAAHVLPSDRIPMLSEFDFCIRTFLRCDQHFGIAQGGYTIPMIIRPLSIFHVVIDDNIPSPTDILTFTFMLNFLTVVKVPILVVQDREINTNLHFSGFGKMAVSTVIGNGFSVSIWTEYGAHCGFNNGRVKNGPLLAVDMNTPFTVGVTLQQGRCVTLEHVSCSDSSRMKLTNLRSL